MLFDSHESWGGYALAEFLLAHGAPIPPSAFFPPPCEETGVEAAEAAAELGFDELSHNAKMQCIYHRARQACHHRKLTFLLYLAEKCRKHRGGMDLPLELILLVAGFMIAGHSTLWWPV